MRSVIATVGFVLWLTGCSATQLASIPARSELVQEPTIGEVRTGEVGDTLVKTARVTESPAIHIAEEVIAKGSGMALGTTVTIKPGTLVPRYKGVKDTCFMAVEPVQFSNFMASGTGEGGICIDPANAAIVKVMLVASSVTFYTPTAPVRYERTNYVDRTAPSFYQELIYNGKTGEAVRFLYREFASDSARPAFNQDVQYDLREGNIVGFKGARVEILEASNTAITYKVLAYFPVPAN